MDNLANQIHAMLEDHPWSGIVLGLGALVLGAMLTNWLAKKVVVRIVSGVVRRTRLNPEAQDEIRQLVTHLSNIVPALILAHGIALVPDLPDWVITVVGHLTTSFIIYSFALCLCDVLDLVNVSYEGRPGAASRPIKGYLQVGKIVIYSAALILIIAALTAQSPFLLLSGLGAMAAVLMLIFRDTILSLVASVQLRSNDMLRVGDWIEMPDLNADGDVIDISLHTIKVQNFDKTVTTIPTHKLVSDSYRNWRFMSEWGGRRIKRSIHIDKSTIGFVSDEAWQAMRRFRLLHPYLDAKEAELERWNGIHAAGDASEVNKRRPTNIGSFRAYVEAYLRANVGITARGTLLVRQLDPTEMGLPLEIYCFTETVVWADYETIQSDIFDHLFAILPEFGLSAFQQPSGADLRALRVVGPVAKTAAIGP